MGNFGGRNLKINTDERNVRGRTSWERKESRDSGSRANHPRLGSSIHRVPIISSLGMFTQAYFSAQEILGFLSAFTEKRVNHKQLLLRGERGRGSNEQQRSEVDSEQLKS